jgi:hypothetical protein
MYANIAMDEYKVSSFDLSISRCLSVGTSNPELRLGLCGNCTSLPSETKVMDGTPLL